jgi:glycosyltransferase involved in cell wall biosynthesis
MKLLYITNIPTPYRQKRFNTMAKIFPKYGIEFEVLFMAKTEPNRKWKISNDSYQYNYKIYSGIHPTIGNFYAHFNPGILLRLLKIDYDVVVVGGMASPTHWLVPFFISNKKIQIMSIESNLFSVKRKKGFARWIKKVLLNKADAFQVTGDPQINYIKYFLPDAKKRHFIKLPNLVDENIFIKEVDSLRNKKESLRSEIGMSSDDQMWVISSRLIEIKGIIPFIKSLVGLKGFHLFLVGDGEQAKEIDSIIKTNKLPVTITGFMQQNDVIRYYAAADLFILPSFKDASPLSPIEAIAARLPILVSQNIGNLNEVLGERNGWSFEPGNIRVLHPILKSILKLNKKELETLGEESRSRYLSFFEAEACINNYANQLLGVAKHV